MTQAPFAVYVHTPFCPSKCGYCDFNSYAMQGEIVERTVAAICTEIDRSPHRGRPAKTIFFGGGTPTFLSEEQLLRIFAKVLEVHPPIPNAEITSEANPGTVDAAKFSAMRQAGFNRISMGAQSFLDEDLIRLDRIHKAGDIERALTAARQAGFDNVNIDLMFALPGQSFVAWKKNLDRAFSLETEHLSLYCLTIEPNTAFYKKQLRGELDLPDDESQVEMYDLCCERAEAKGFKQYEISNFAKPGRECRHNLCYWYGEEYAGYGPGAVGFLEGGMGSLRMRPSTSLVESGNVAEQELGHSGKRSLPPYSQNHRLAADGTHGQAAHATYRIATRYTNLKHPERYCVAVEQGDEVAYEKEPIDSKTHLIERIMLGLRLNEGIHADLVQPLKIEKLKDRGWLLEENARISLTNEGRHFCSEVALELI